MNSTEPVIPLDAIQILSKIRQGFAKSRCETLEDAGKALVWQVLDNAAEHLKGKSLLSRSAVGLLQGFAMNQDYPSPVELEDVA